MSLPFAIGAFWVDPRLAVIARGSLRQLCSLEIALENLGRIVLAPFLELCTVNRRGKLLRAV